LGEEVSMSPPRIDPSIIQLPRWLYITASIAILFHLGSVSVRTLAAMSGPWPMGAEGSGTVYPPQFAASIVDALSGKYLKLVRLNHDYHFASNQPNQPAYKLEVKLKDRNGQVLQTLSFPDPQANAWVRHRQKLLVGFLANDSVVRTPQSEVIPAPGQKAPEWTYWKPLPNSSSQSILATESVNDLPRGGTVYAPSDMEMIFVRSYVRYLLRQHDAASVEMSRIAVEPIPPAVMFDSSFTASAFEPRTYSYGDRSQ
jgi:hypothetical protein